MQGTLLTVLLLAVLLPLLLYVPAVQDWVSQTVVDVLNRSSESMEYEVGRVRLGFPLQLKADDVVLKRKADGRTMLRVGQLQTGLDDIPWRQPCFVVNNLTIRDVTIDMDTLTTSLSLSGSLRSLRVRRIQIDPSLNVYSIAEAVADTPILHLSLLEAEADSTDSPAPDWSLAVGRVQIRQGDVALDMPAVRPSALQVSGLGLSVSGISYDRDGLKATLEELQLREELSGLDVQHLAGKLSLGNDRLSLADVDLRLAPDDYLRAQAAIDFGITDSIPYGMAQLSLDAALDSANLARLATPYLPTLAETWPARQLRVQAEACLTPDSLAVSQLHLVMPDHIDLTASGHARHPFHNTLRQASLVLRGTATHAEPLLSALVAAADQRPYAVPDSLQLDASLSQRGQELDVDISLAQRGRQVLQADAHYDIPAEAYRVSAVTRALNVSDYVPSLVADAMTLRLQADGRHFWPQHRYTRLEASLQLDSLNYLDALGHPDSLRRVTAEASLVNGQYLAVVHSDHPTLRLDTRLEGCYRRDSVSVHGYLAMPAADLDHLPYYATRTEGGEEASLGHLTFSSRVDAAYDWAEVASLNLSIDTLQYRAPALQQDFGNIRLLFDSRARSLQAKVDGGDAHLSLAADCSVAQLPALLDSLLAHGHAQWTTMRPDFEQLRQRLPQLSVQLDMARQNPFTQALEYRTALSFDRLQLSLHNDRLFTLDATLSNLSDAVGSADYDTIGFHLRPSIASAPAGAYDYSLLAVHHDIRERQAQDFQADGSLMPDSLTLHLRCADGRRHTLYDVHTALSLADDTMTLRLLRGPTLLDQQFTVNDDNYVRLTHYLDLDRQKPHTRARLLMDGPQNVKLHFYTRSMADHDTGNQLLFLIRNLDLAFASRVMEWDSDVTGLLQLTASADVFPDSLSARLRAGISHLALAGYSTDTLGLNASYLMASRRRDATASLTIDSIDRATFAAVLADSVSVRGRLDALPLPLAGTFLPREMKLWGSASGNIALLGRDMDHATISGGLAMDDAGLDYTSLGVRLRFPADTLLFARNRLLIRDYRILAADDQHPITLRGLVDMSREMADPAVSLTVAGENVSLLRSQKLTYPDQYITGTLPISTNIKVSGKASALAVTGRLSVLPGTNLRCYIPDDPLEASSRVDQLVEFVRFDQVDRLLQTSRLRRRQPAATPGTAGSDGLNMELRIDVDNSTRVAALLAGPDNNRIDIMGGAALTMQCGHDGRLTMSGNYDITSGKVDYKLPILPMVKTFNIDNRSSLTWQGSDPANPDIDITAREEVRTAVNDESGSRVVKFLASIHIAGKLDALNLTFDCDAPEDGPINAEIASLNADERSKAALMLLVAQTYIGPGNSSSMGLGTANAALNSMLNRQMDSMLSGMKGTNIDLGIDTYNTDAGNTRTNYSVKVSQQLFNDRFRATIGGQISSGGDVGQSSGARLGDMSLEWMIRRDGSHYLKLFRTTNYGSVIEGELIETGISYVQERQGYRLRQLFVPTSKKRQQQMQQMLREMQQREEQAEREARRARLGRPASAPTTPADTVTSSPNIILQ